MPGLILVRSDEVTSDRTTKKTETTMLIGQRGGGGKAVTEGLIFRKSGRDSAVRHHSSDKINLHERRLLIELDLSSTFQTPLACTNPSYLAYSHSSSASIS